MRIAGILLAWALTVGVAFYAGTQWGGDAPRPLPVADLGAARASAASSQDPGPILLPASRAPGAAVPGATRGGGASTKHAGETVPAEAVEDFTLEGITDPQEAMDLLMRQVAALLAKGKDGHLDLLRLLDEQVVGSETMKGIFRSEANAARFIYPWLEFLVSNKDSVVDVMDTVYATMADDPAALEGFDNDTLEIFTEGLAFVLPGAVDEERLARFRGHAARILDRPEADQPAAVQRVRRDIERMLPTWAPPLAADEALEALRSGTLRGAEAVALLQRVPPDRLQGLDLGSILESGVAAGDWRTIQQLGQVPLGPRDIAVLDAAILKAAGTEGFHVWTLRTYLQGTGRAGWPEARPLVEQGLGRQEEEARGPFFEVLAHLNPRPPKEDVLYLLDAYRAPQAVADTVRAQFDLR